MKESGSPLRMLKFALFSASAGLIQVAAFTALNEWLKGSYWAAYLPALALSVVWIFTFNRKYTFRSDANVARNGACSFVLSGVYAAVHLGGQRARGRGLE